MASLSRKANGHENSMDWTSTNFIEFPQAVGFLSKAMDWGMNLVEESEYWLLENLWKAMRGTSPPVPLVIAEKDYKAHSSGNSVVYGEICCNESKNRGVRRCKITVSEKINNESILDPKKTMTYHLLNLHIDTVQILAFGVFFSPNCLFVQPTSCLWLCWTLYLLVGSRRPEWKWNWNMYTRKF